MIQTSNQSITTIDCHTHLPLSPVAPFISYSKNFPSFETFLRALDTAHVTKAVLFCGPKKGPMRSENEILHTRIDPCRFRFVLGAWLNPKHDKAADLHALVKKHEFHGLKLHPVLDHYRLNEPIVKPLIEKAIELDIPIFIHSGWGAEGKVEDIGKLAEEFSEGTFVCCHCKEEFGLNDRFSHINMAAHHSNVFLESSYIPHPRRLADAVNILGMERILFGSDYPWGAQNINWEKTKVICAPISQAAKKQILSENAKKLLNL